MKVIQKKQKIKFIKNYLMANQDIFFEPLYDRVNIDDYSKKLFENSTQFWLMDNDKFIGFLACYLNDFEKQIGFISTISIIKQYQGRGGGHLLINYLESYAKEKNFKTIVLEVASKNKKAISFYEKLKYKKVKINDKNYFVMEKNIF